MKKEKRTVKVTEKKLADGIIKLDCEATAIEVNNALKEAAEAFAMQMGVRPAPGTSHAARTVSFALWQYLSLP